MTVSQLIERPEYDHLFCNAEMAYQSLASADYQLIRVWPSRRYPGFWHLERTSAAGGRESFERPACKAFVAYMLSECWRAPPAPDLWIANRAQDDAVGMIEAAHFKHPLIYFLQAGPFIKIGFTAGTPEARIDDLKTGCPYEIKLIGTIPGPKKLESELHRRFAAHRAHLEWFHAHPDILGYVHEGMAQ